MSTHALMAAVAAAVLVAHHNDEISDELQRGADNLRCVSLLCISRSLSCTSCVSQRASQQKKHNDHHHRHHEDLLLPDSLRRRCVCVCVCEYADAGEISDGGVCVCVGVVWVRVVVAVRVVVPHAMPPLPPFLPEPQQGPLEMLRTRWGW